MTLALRIWLSSGRSPSNLALLKPPENFYLLVSVLALISILAPHIHAILWIKDAPILGKNTETQVEEYIKSISTCSKPDQTSSLTLHALVSQFQTHKCNRCCLKSYKSGNKYFKKSRFGFPRPVKSNFTLGLGLGLIVMALASFSAVGWCCLWLKQLKLEIFDFGNIKSSWLWSWSRLPNHGLSWPQL